MSHHGTPNYNRTIYACFIGYIVQAIVNNFVPLLFLTFQSTFGISLPKITMLVTFNFLVQLFVDLAAAHFVDKIGYKICIIASHIFAASGLLLLAVLPFVMNDAFTGILIAVMIYAIGGGLNEVLVSPIMESCPTDNKEKAMSMLHSFYCWGHVGVVLISTIFFSVFGIGNWRVLTILWAAIALGNAVLFFISPIAPLLEEGVSSLSIKQLFSKRILDRKSVV